MSDNTLTTELTAEQAIAVLREKNKSKYATPAAVTSVTSAGDYLPYIQVMGGNSEVVKRGEFPIGNFALMKQKKASSLGDSFVALLLSWRPKAMEYKPQVKAYYDPNSAVFTRVQERAQQPQSNCGYGPEFLLWLPDFATVCTFFMGNISGRMEAPNLIDRLENGNQICKLKIEIAENKKGIWHTAKMYPHDLQIVMPDMSTIVAVIDKFNTPPVVEEAEPAGEQRG